MPLHSILNPDYFMRQIAQLVSHVVFKTPAASFFCVYKTSIMKPIKLLGLLTLLFASTVPALAQKKAKDSPTTKDNRMAKQMDKSLAGLSKIDISKGSEVQKAASTQLKDEWLVDDALRLINAEIERGRKEIAGKEKEYIPEPSKTKYLDKDLLPLVADMPEPEANLPLARQLMKPNGGDDIYSKYIEKLKRIREQMLEIAKKTIPDDMKDPEKMKQEAYKNAAMAEQSLNNNPVIQQMGGIEKLKNMTPEQREALAKQMSANVKSNPSAYSGKDTDPRKAFTNKMMTDPGYAARFNGMNDQQKQEEYKAFLAENGFSNNSSQGNLDKSMADRNKAATAIAIGKRNSLIMEHVQEMTNVVSGIQQKTDELFSELNRQLSEEYQQRVAALHEVEHGEAGRSKETHPLDLAYQIVRYPINLQNAAANKLVWKSKVDLLKVMIADYNDFLEQYWGKDKSTDWLMIERGSMPPAIVVSMIDQLIDLAKLASFLSNQNAGWQKNYEMIVLQQYD